MTGAIIGLVLLATIGLVIFLSRRSKVDTPSPTPDGGDMDAGTSAIAHLAAHQGSDHHGGDAGTGGGSHDGGVGQM